MIFTGQSNKINLSSCSGTSESKGGGSRGRSGVARAGITSRQERYLCQWSAQSSLCHCPLANLSAYHRLKHSWYAARSSEHAAAAFEGADGVVDEDDLLRPNTMPSAAPLPLCANLPFSFDPVSGSQMFGVSLRPRRISALTYQRVESGIALENASAQTYFNV